MNTAPDCVFCKIRDGQIPSAKLYEDARTFAIMDINPLNPGHSLVIIKAHAPTIFDADPADLAAAVATAKRVGTAVTAAVNADGLNVMQANGAAAFQSVPHLHLHLVPRFANDGKGFDWKLVPGNRDEILANAAKITAALGGK
ncbi:MAG: HIT family protein [Candidatus Rokubacteria bacterium]|nr:HIT family protein [Candidatus Rokubacteria bacterium]